MEKQYISIKEACEHFNKSISTIRRIVKETPLDKLKKEKLVTGHEKIYIQFDYLNNYFGIVKDKPNNSDSSQLNNSNEYLIEILKIKLESKENELKALTGIITTLNNELENKNKQIEAAHKEKAMLLELNHEKNLYEAKSLDTFENNKKRKWWQRG